MLETTENEKLTQPPPADEYFDTSHLKADLKGRFVRGSAITMLGQAARFVIQTGSTVILARLLSPKDYGLVAMVTAVTGFIMTFKDLGLSTATVQKAQTNHQQISTLFWINVAISIIAMLITAALAPAIAWFYNEPRLTWIGLALSTSFLFVGLSVQHQALLRRQMRFTAIVTRDIAAMLIGTVLAIVLAWRGAVYWSLVAMQVGAAVSGTIMLWLVCKWRPGLPVRGAGVRSMVHFGLGVTGFQAVNYFARNFDNILLGRFWGASVLGLYSRAYSLFMLPITQIRAPLTAVALPALSRLQNEPDKCAKYYYRFVSVLTFITVPIMGFLFVCSENIIRLLLGERWLGANAIFKILAIAGFIQAAETTRGLILLSSGLGKRYFTYGLLRSVFLVGCFAVGIPWGGFGVAAGFTIGDYLILFPALWYCFRGTPLSITGFFRAIAQPTIAGLISTGVMFLTYRSFLLEQHDFVVIGVCLLVGLLSYFGVWTIIPGGPTTLWEFSSYLRLVFRNKTNRQQDKLNV
jgi:PST family polysaccharide transporter